MRQDSSGKVMSSTRKLAILTPVSSLSYYKKFNTQFWDSIDDAMFYSGRQFELSVILGVENYNFEELLKQDTEDCQFLRGFNVEVIKVSGNPCRFELLKKAYNDKYDYYMFLDFDDELNMEYFNNLSKAVDKYRKSDIIVGLAVRKLKNSIIPKKYLCWRPDPNQTEDEYFYSGNYGNNIWGRLFSKKLVKRVIDKYGELKGIDRRGFGEEWCLHHILWFNRETPVGYSDSLYLWNYGNMRTLSKTINFPEAMLNIESSLNFVPPKKRRVLRSRYIKLLNDCMNSTKSNK